MEKNKSILALGLLVLLSAPILSGCSKEEVLTINILTSEDYIYIADDGVTTLNDYFEDWYEETYNVPIKVSYETSDTNETMYNLLKTGKTRYDLMCTSDYIVQKLAKEDEIELIDLDEVPNYRDYTSRYIDSKFRRAFELPNNAKENDTYSVGYMWGTLGIIFNPEYVGFSDNVTPEEAIHDASSWSMLWDEKYKHTLSIKDSMRDTFAVATMKVFDEETEELKNKYLSGQISAEKYYDELNSLFNFMCEENLDIDIVNSLNKALVSLKANSFGLEIDSGKQDIVTGKVGINLAWSGDATNAMWEAEENGEVDLLYSVPENGSNLWFDGWVMPKVNNRDKEIHDAAMAYLNYLSDPENAYLNMSYVGYSSFIAGDWIVDYVRDNFDVRSSDVFYIDDEENYFDLYYLDDAGEEQLFYYDDLGEILTSNPQLYYYKDDENSEKVFIDEYYNDRNFDYENNEPDVDLRYFFCPYEIIDGEMVFDESNSTLEDYTLEDCFYYSDDNYYLEDELTGEYSISVGGIFFCTYPEEQILTRCCIMADYGENNKMALKLWEDFKSDPLPDAAKVILFVELVLMVIGGGYIAFTSKVKLALIKKRKENY